MVDVTGKDATRRTAVAAGTLRTRADVVELIATGGLPKGDALATARVAGKRQMQTMRRLHRRLLFRLLLALQLAEKGTGIVRPFTPRARRQCVLF